MAADVAEVSVAGVGVPIAQVQGDSVAVPEGDAVEELTVLALGFGFDGVLGHDIDRGVSGVAGFVILIILDATDGLNHVGALQHAADLIGVKVRELR